MDNQNNNPNNRNNRQGLSFILIVTLITAMLVMMLYQFQGNGNEQEISYDEFLKMVDDGEVDKVLIQSNQIVITAKKEKGERIAKEYYTGLVQDDTLSERLYEAGVEYEQEIPDTTSAIAIQLLATFLPIALLVGMIVWMTRKMSKGGGVMGIGKSNAKMYVEKQTGVTFRDVAGQDEAKESLQEVVDFLHNPGKYTSVGAKLPKGALLVGPPGTGKTLLAKAVAGEANVPFFSLSGSAFVEMYVGVGASRVRDLFKQAQQMAPCIIFIDEIDAIGKSRDNQLGSNDEKTVDLEAIALATSGAVGSDLANMINEAAINAVKHGRNAVCQQDLFEAVEVVLVGKEKKDRIMSQEERRIVSYHEVGHALISALQKDSEPVQKITIVPRTMGALGYVMQTPEEEKFLNTKKELEAMLVGMLGGRAAEEIVFDTVTTGASNDIEKATSIARAMITQYGMSEKFGLIGLESIQHRYLDGRPVANCGEETASEIDHEVMKMLKNAYEEAKRLLAEHRSSLDKIADFLIEKETITGKEFMDIFYEVEGIDPETKEKKKEERITMNPVEEI